MADIQWKPTASEIIKNHWAAVTSYTVGHDHKPGAFANLSKAVDYSNEGKQLQEIAHILEAAAGRQRSLEQAYLSNFLNVIPQGTQLHDKFAETLNADNYSMALDIARKTTQGWYDLDLSWVENEEIWKDIFEFTSNRQILNTFGQFMDDQNALNNLIVKDKYILGSGSLQKTPREIIEASIEAIEKNFDKQTKATSKQQASYKKYLVTLKKVITEELSSSFGVKALDTKIQNLDELDSIKEYRKGGTKAQRNATIENLVMNKIGQALSGITVEVSILGNTGINTGTVKQDGKDVKADVVSAENFEQWANGEYIYEYAGNDIETDRELIKSKKTLQELNNFINNKEFENAFIIEFSAKEQTLRKEFNGFLSKKSVEFAGKGNLATRLPRLESLLNAEYSGSITDFLFALINTGNYLSMHGSVEQVTHVLAAMSVNWMFDGFDAVIDTSLEDNQYNQRLHAYYVNGHYYFISDILNGLVKELYKHIGSNFVYAHISPIKENPYDEANLTNVVGSGRWERVQGIVLDRTYIELRLQADKLFNTFF